VVGWFFFIIDRIGIADYAPGTPDPGA
jgi:hypothetical protein